MALKIIGSGFGRTGTMSLKMALEQLGFGPCHHMAECMGDPAQPPKWTRIVAGDPVDCDHVFEGFNSQVDWPGAHVWREAAVAFPDAKVIHSVRPEEKWWASFSPTIGRFMDEYESTPLPPHIHEMVTATLGFIGHQTFSNQWQDKDTAIAAFRRREADVRAAIAPERLLVFDVAEGWAPLCAFLDVPIPDTPFPRSNSQSEFWEHFGPRA